MNDPKGAVELTLEAAKEFVPPRMAGSRKGQNGTVLVVGGGHIYHGAPVLSSLAALRSGTDLVYTAVPNIHAAAVRAYSPDLIVLPMADQKLTRGSASKLLGQVPKDLDSAAIGMGLAVHETGALIRLVDSLLDMDVRLSLDAGALVPEILPIVSNKNTVLTPHAGEFKRLFGWAPPDDVARRASAVQDLAGQHGITILLKGQTDVITNGSATYLVSKTNPAMTVGGTGDVLSGLVAGVLARNRKAIEAAAAAALINSRAGHSAYEKMGLHMTATDLVSGIPASMMPFDQIC